jgi:hypothetical protein
LNSDRNDFYTSGGSARFSIVAGFTNAAGERTTLSSWQSTTADDASSVASDPMFVSDSNLHIATPSSPVANMGLQAFGITTDFDGSPRNQPADIGADEFPDIFPILTINDVTTAEGNYPATVPATFNLHLSAAQLDSVWVSYQTTGGTASPDTDYVAVSEPRRVAIPPNVTDKTFTITIKGDPFVEPSESFHVKLSEAIAATIGDSVGIGTILNDDNGTGVPEGDRHPVTFLGTNAPNPFSGTTTLALGLEQPGRVRIDVFDVQGRRIRALLDQMLPAGNSRVEWNGLDDSGRRVEFGFYVVQMRVNGRALTRRVQLVR